MPEPTPKRPDPTRTEAQQPAKGQIPVAKRLEGGQPKSSAVIPAKSYRVRELPPPPVIEPPQADRTETDEVRNRDTLPDVLSAPPERTVEAAIELDALQIRTPTQWSFLRRRVRIPPRWEQWLANPQRQNPVGVGLSVGIHVAVIVLLAFVLRWNVRTPAAEPIHARVVESATARAPQTMPERNAPLPEPVVRQITAGALETVSLGPTPDETSEISNLKSKNPGASQKEQVVRVDPPVAMVEGSVLQETGSEAHPTVAPKVAPPVGRITAEDRAPGLAAGSQVPPDLLQAIDALMQEKLKRRTPAGRSEGVRYGGGTPQSEEAVERALHWLAAHQRPDGSWSFNHLSEACQHYCTHPGSEGSSSAATALALLPFLGAGYTHKQGEFQDVVERGLGFLKSHGIRISYGNDLRDGSMYGHALATIALCEAYGMTNDPDLKEPAQGALDYIAYVQDTNTGGWRYNPGEPGDTTVTGWMLMGLKSGQMARLSVQTPAIFAAQRFLNSVQNQDGSQYGYQSRQPRPTTTAVGLLCRMYTGWRRDNPGLVQGIAHLNTWGPSKESLYYDYYATQVLFHWAGPEWDTWNRKMREHLISTQEREGHPSGSWYFESPQSAAGGRLYNTAMATMILEVYYRFMPLYGEGAVKSE